MASGPADVVRALCKARGHATDPAAAALWPVFVGFVPNKPDALLVVLDTGGTDDGRLMQTGESIRHPGIEIIVRALDYPTGWAKANEIARDLEKVRREEVTTPEGVYRVDNFSQRGDVIAVGQEPGTTRQLFTINATLTYTEI